MTSEKHIIGLLITSTFCIVSVSSSTIVSGEPEKNHLKVPDIPVVLTQLPVGTPAEKGGALANGMLRSQYGDTARIVLWQPGRGLKVLTEGFDSACDPSLSFDGKRILFAGKKTSAGDWNIYERNLDGSGLRRITSGGGDCRNPSYQSALYTIVSPEPWYQVTFVVTSKDHLNEMGIGAVSNLYSCKLDGSGIRQLTYNLSGDMDPILMYNGRLLFASWQRSTLQHGPLGTIGLFGINIDGADFAVFAGKKGKRIKHMPCATANGIVVFVESDRVAWDGAGTLGSVTIRRPLYSYRPVTKVSDGLFHSPSPLPDGTVLVSRRSPDQNDTHGIYNLDPITGDYKLMFDDPQYHDIQARAVYSRPEPDGRSSVVSEKDPQGKLYCLNIYMNDLKPQWLPRGSVKRLRVIEGIPVTKKRKKTTDNIALNLHAEFPCLAPRRILGDIPLKEDGSFNVAIPAGIPIELQIVDAEGMALRTCSWIWAKNHEPRGCIGCHEDPELTPENFLVEALTSASLPLTLPPHQRRTVTYKKDIQPIIKQKCVTCHDPSKNSFPLVPDHPIRNYRTLLAKNKQTDQYKFLQPGSARTSKLIWHLYGRDTSRPWDDTKARQTIGAMPPAPNRPLSDSEKQIFVEWIDLGAMLDFYENSNPLNEK